MEKIAKRFIAYLLAAAAVSSAVAGCQKPGVPSVQDQGTEMDLNKQRDTPEKESGDIVKELNMEKGKTWEAREPKKAELSPEDYEGWEQLLNEHQISEDFAKGLAQFAYESGSIILKGTKGNENYSPLSLYYTLALAGCGAQGETASQILEKLGVENQQELADQCSKLYQWYTYSNQREQEMMAHYGIGDYRSAIRLGNSLWISGQLPVYEEYQKLAAEKFFASSYGVDFGNPDTGKQMGKWIAEKTNGVLEPQIEVDPATLMAILNTLYFYGGWAEPFAEEKTQEDSFYLEDGGSVTVPYLNREQREGSFVKEEGYTLSCLDTDNRCRMVFLLPDEGRSVGEFLESPEKMRDAMQLTERDWVDGKVIWKIPKFAFGSGYSLNDPLKAMGINRMFGPQAEFGGISPDSLLVSSVIQQTHIGVDEQGVEGAAYTMIAMARGALKENEEEAEMILNRPFLFGIWDDCHNAWLFLGICRNPAEEAGEEAEEAPCGLPLAEHDVLLTEAPEIQLSDALSSTMSQFSIQPGNYSWRWQENGEMRGVEACGSHPLDIDVKRTDILDIPDYNQMEEVSYIFGCAVMPKTLTVREWDISQLGKTEAAKPLETVYTDQWIIPLKHGKVYEFVAEWPEEEFGEKGFSGEASYVAVTD